MPAGTGASRHKMHVAQHFAAVSLYHAPEIMDFVAPGQAPDESVRDQRRKPPGERFILSIFPPAAYDIVSGWFLESAINLGMS